MCIQGSTAKWVPTVCSSVSNKLSRFFSCLIISITCVPYNILLNSCSFAQIIPIRTMIGTIKTNSYQKKDRNSFGWAIYNILFKTSFVNLSRHFSNRNICSFTYLGLVMYPILHNDGMGTLSASVHLNSRPITLSKTPALSWNEVAEMTHAAHHVVAILSRKMAFVNAEGNFTSHLKFRWAWLQRNWPGDNQQRHRCFFNKEESIKMNRLKAGLLQFDPSISHFPLWRIKNHFFF